MRFKLPFKKERRCRHRHSIKTHKSCFNSDGTLKIQEEVVFPKILVFDIETAPLEAYVWSNNVWGGNVTDDQVISDWYMLTWSAKWLYEDNIISSRLTGKESIKEDDGRLVKELWNLLNKADLVISHNGTRFDVPNMNTRFIVNNLPPTTPYQSIDTFRVAKRQFGFTHNSLDALAKALGLEGTKLHTGFDLWKKARAGDDSALEYMEEYNRMDVKLLEDVYLKIRPWIKSHPNLGLYMLAEGSVCPNCGNSKLEWVKDQYYYTQANRYPVFRCDCGAYGRSRKGTPAKEKQDLVVGLAR